MQAMKKIRANCVYDLIYFSLVGVVSFDYQGGFWLIHSTPHFSPNRTQGYSWPKTGQTYGQSFLCISFAYSAMNNIGEFNSFFLTSSINLQIVILN